MATPEADLLLAAETRCGMWGHIFRPHDILGVACIRCGTAHSCPECSGFGEHHRAGLCRACYGLGCRCMSPDEHEYLLLLVAAGAQPPPEGEQQ